MESLKSAKVWKFGDNIDTDVITPTKYLSLPLYEMKKHTLEPINPKFAKEVQAGDIIVAGKNFGCGSSRETAVMVLKALKIGAIVAESFARIFFRNSIAQGMPILTCPHALKYFEEGEKVVLDIKKAVVKNIDQGNLIQGIPLAPDMLDILKKGGILSMLKEKTKG
jgi:3-isopropylmalate/(R)-2-methylmalate dehydratase small subunit